MRLSRKLHHPNIVKTYEFGNHDGRRYITMEALQGQDLAAWLDANQWLPPLEQVLKIAVQAASGLGAAHESDIIHRDIKPSNVFLVEDGRTVRVMDFGIARGSSVEATNTRVGTPLFMAPEQLRGEGVIGPHTDLYAFGGLLYQLLTKRPPFLEKDLLRLMFKHLHEMPEPPSAMRPEGAEPLPEALDELVLQLLAKDPDDRPGGLRRDPAAPADDLRGTCSGRRARSRAATQSSKEPPRPAPPEKRPAPAKASPLARVCNPSSNSRRKAGSSSSPAWS